MGLLLKISGRHGACEFWFAIRFVILHRVLVRLHDGALRGSGC